MPELLIRGARLIDPFHARDEVADVLVSRGRISGVGGKLDPAGREVIAAEGMVLSPGFLDLHVHLREPGREDAEGLRSGLEAALRAGFTAVCCMPNTQPPLDNPAVVEGLYGKAAGMGSADLFPVGCITRAREGRELAEMALMHRCGAGVKAFSDDGRGVADSGLMRRALEYASAFGGVIISHAEDPTLSAGGQVNEGEASHRLGLRGLPALAEEVMTARDLLLAEATGARLHLAHVSTARALDMVREAKGRGVPVTAEVTPHHLVLSDEDLVDYDTAFKVNPPLRTPRDVEALRAGLVDGTVDAIATDHAPHTAEEKEREWDYAPCGIVGMESAFAVLYTELVEGGVIGLDALLALLTAGPARVLGLGPPQYGAGVVEGARADLVLLETGVERTLDSGAFASKGRNCPFQGRRVTGRVGMTIKNGKIAWKAGGGRGGRP